MDKTLEQVSFESFQNSVELELNLNGELACDFVLVWRCKRADENDNIYYEKNQKREIFEKNLAMEGLQLERTWEGSNFCFTKITAPFKVLIKYADILKLRMPLNEVKLDKVNSDQLGIEVEGHRTVEDDPKSNTDSLMPKKTLQKKLGLSTNWFKKNGKTDTPKPLGSQRPTSIFSSEKFYLFDKAAANFFNEKIRAKIVDFIIKRTAYLEDSTSKDEKGIDRLISDKVYVAAYPLHNSEVNDILDTEWASLKKFWKYQPLDTIKDYFGVQVGLYYAWLGYYTQMLIPISIFGILCVLYGVFTIPTNIYSNDICNETMHEYKMCPLCSQHNSKECKFWNLTNACFLARFTHALDNRVTVAFAIIMSLWAAIFTECWKRYLAKLTHKWDLSTLDNLEELPRLEFLNRLRKSKKTSQDEETNPYVPFWRARVPYTILSATLVILMVVLAAAAVIGVIAYRVTVRAVLRAQRETTDGSSRGRDKMIVVTTSAIINLICISMLNKLYTRIAKYLTEFEMIKTQTEFENSLTLKIYALQFVNYYSSLFYIAFFKGKFIGAPHERRSYFIQEKCGPAGCMSELCIQLAIIMVGKQIVNAVKEMFGPPLRKWIKNKRTSLILGSKKVEPSTRWAMDLELSPWSSLFSEYLEMILQFGFITIFVAAFPLAPFFALLNNILEMRFDAKKMLTYTRRPVGISVLDIGIWTGIIQTISKLAVISNALIIAFTSTCIPKLVYYNQHGSLEGFMKYTMTSFDTSSLNSTRTDIPEVCWYAALHYDHTYHREHKRYGPNTFYWEVLAVRLAFVVIFQNSVNFIVILLKGIIPDVPKKLREEIRKRAEDTTKNIVALEKERALILKM